MKRYIIRSLLFSLFVFSAVSVDAGLRENMIMARVPKHYKKWTTVRPQQTFILREERVHSSWNGLEEVSSRKLDQFGDPIRQVDKCIEEKRLPACKFVLNEASYIVMEGHYTPARKTSSGRKIQARESVRFGWKVNLTNLSEETESVFFYVRFFDREQFKICSVGSEYWLAAGETKTFQEDAYVPLYTFLKADAISCTLTLESEY